MAQTNKEGVVVDERFNGGGQMADYIVEVLGRRVEGYWSPRYGAIEHTPNAGIYGPKVMIINESAGSGGDALPWLFKYNKLGTVVGKRTWGGLVGISEIPVLMDGGEVTSPERRLLLARRAVGRREPRRRPGCRRSSRTRRRWPRVTIRSWSGRSPWRWSS